MQNQENGTLQNHPTGRTQNIHKFTKWIEPQRHNTRQSDIRVVQVTAVEEKVGQKKNSWRNKGQNFPQINQTYTCTDVRCWTDHQAGPAREGPWRRTAQSRSRRPESKATSWPQKEKSTHYLQEGDNWTDGFSSRTMAPQRSGTTERRAEKKNEVTQTCFNYENITQKWRSRNDISKLKTAKGVHLQRTHTSTEKGLQAKGKESRERPQPLRKGWRQHRKL